MSHSRIVIVATAIATALMLLPASAGVGAQPSATDRQIEAAKTGPPEKTPYVAGAQAEDVGPNPWLSFRAGTNDVDFGYWTGVARTESASRASALGAPSRALAYHEAEAPGATGDNDTIGTAEAIVGLGTDVFETSAVRITGAGVSGSPILSAIGPFPEDDGSIPLANSTGLSQGNAVTTSGVVGDGPWGSAGAGTGDFDFFAVTAAAGDYLSVDVDTVDPFGDLDSFVVIWDSAGVPIAFNDDDGSSFDSFLAVPLPTAGTYFVSIGGFGSFAPNDPFDSGSGPGVGSEGDYDVTLALVEIDVDVFAIELDAGDVLGASLSSGLRISLLAADGTEQMGSSQDVSFIYPPASLLPGGGSAVLNYVAPVDGTYYLAATVDSPYAIDLRLFRPRLEQLNNQVQRIFLDFDGATLNTGIFGGPPVDVTLSPLRRFLRRWGLTPRDESAVIDAIVAATEESLAADIATFGNNPNFEIEILNSRDHADPWGDPDVSRVVVGGTIPEFGLGTIGIAQSIDPGNFGTAESAVVLLDLLSARPGIGISLNEIPIDPSATKIDLIGVAVGNIVAHEAGHFFGNWHTDQFNPQANIMDQGGNLPGTIGLGPDGIFGSADDDDVDFGVDVFVPNEGFTGIEDTLNVIGFGLTTNN